MSIHEQLFVGQTFLQRGEIIRLIIWHHCYRAQQCMLCRSSMAESFKKLFDVLTGSQVLRGCLFGASGNSATALQGTLGCRTCSGGE